ncbi:hypothetical protein QBC46DRAFT_383828 [Diplogelasinospora grovesii]|uniref:AA1-like domain-containing protein n=1 Tax=Diplogelasinospora grovesii TaxID=303347 RepID=A0AAN6S5A3_9PEZI|nr:hypothetical protein QBC46DRAFT_383828 [Diplogelasinospora grovesii]
MARLQFRNGKPGGSPCAMRYCIAGNRHKQLPLAQLHLKIEQSLISTFLLLDLTLFCPFIQTVKMYALIPALLAAAASVSAAPAVAPAVALAAARDTNGPGCTSASLGSFEWSIQGFDFHASYIFTTPAHQNSWGYVNFNLTNPAVPYVASCSASSNQLNDFFYGTMPYKCTLPDGVKGGSTLFDFSRPSGELRVNQTWTCNDQDPQYPTTFTGYGAVNLTLECTDDTWMNPNWTIGQIYSDREVKCAPVDAIIKPYQLTAVA